MTLNTELWNGKVPTLTASVDSILVQNQTYFYRNLSAPGNQRKFTISFEGKFTDIPSLWNAFFLTWDGTQSGAATNHFGIIRTTGNGIAIGSGYAGSNTFFVTTYLSTAQVFRDLSAWYHIVVAVDTTQAVAANRIRLYVNGQEVTSFATDNRASLTQNTDLAVGSTTQTHYYANTIRTSGTSTTVPRYYTTNWYHIDGVALTPGAFGAFDVNGHWITSPYSGPAPSGQSGHWKFVDSSNLGNDLFNLGNNLTASSAINTQNLIQSTGSYSGTVALLSGLSNSIGTNLSAFDGNLASGWGHWADAARDWQLTLDFPINTSGLTIEAYAGGSALTITLESSGGVTASNSWTDTSWKAFSSLSDIKKIRFTTASGSGYLLALRVNGVILVDTSQDLFSVTTLESPSNNYCTWNPLDAGEAFLSQGNLVINRSVAAWRGCRATFGLQSGKWYWEFRPQVNHDSSNKQIIGISKIGQSLADYLGSSPSGWGYDCVNGNKVNNGSSVSYGNSWKVGDVIGIAFDADNGTLTFYKNNISQGVAYTGLVNGPYLPSISVLGKAISRVNFGQHPFQFDPPAGYQALCTANLPTPTIADGSTVMDVVLYTGNGSTQTISGLGFSPDLVWIKARNAVTEHVLADTARGANLALFSNLTNAESSATNLVTGFTSDGFSVGANGGTGNTNVTYVGWAWDAGSSTVTNNDGSITSQVRANPSAGFSIVSWTPQATAGTVGHGLNAAPEFIITKDRDSANGWFTYHKSLGTQNYLVLNLTNAATSNPTVFTTAPTSTVFDQGIGFTSTIGYGKQICYCFAPVAGYSSFGTYTANFNSDGPFIYLGFKPALFITKKISSTSMWNVQDNRRPGYNVTNESLFANDAQSTNYGGLSESYYRNDFLSNGVKIRNTGDDHNNSGATYLYCAWAENPFQYARAR